MLSDAAKRREYDSTDEFDDTLPTSCNPADFFKVCRGQATAGQAASWPQYCAAALVATNPCRYRCCYIPWLDLPPAARCPLPPVLGLCARVPPQRALERRPECARRRRP